MELKNKYSKQIIYSNQKFEDQIWYNQQIMTFLNFHNFRKVFSTQIFRKTFSWKPSQIFLWLESVFRWPESVFRWPESVFRWPTFRKANKHRKVWKVISGKQTQPKNTFFFYCWTNWGCSWVLIFGAGYWNML